jgi:methyl-accepting chemotaxis protein
MKNLKIGFRLAGTFGIVLLLLAILCLVANRQMSVMNAATDNVANDRAVKQQLVNEIKQSTFRIALLMYRALDEQSADGKAVIVKDMKAQSETNTRNYKRLEEISNTPEGSAMYQKVASVRTQYSAALKPVYAQLDANDGAAARATLMSVIPLQTATLKALEDFVELQKTLMNQAVQESADAYDSAIKMLWGIAVLALLVTIALSTISTRAIVQPLQRAVLIAQTIAAGDLRVQIEQGGRNETGQLLNALKEMGDNLKRIVGGVRGSTETIMSASSEIASGNLDLSSRTEEQASSLEETASAMEQLTSTVKQNADNARQASELAVNASDIAVRGGSVVDEVVQTMSSINDSSKRIVDIISVIDGIAFQTNILALNAAVEAARAGEQGRGFAVVASEVRSLAQRSAAAAKEIKVLIDDSVHKVDSGSKLVEQAGQTMDEVVSSVKRVTDIVMEITSASQEQSDGIEQVNQAVSQMDEATQQNAALVEQAAAAAQSMQQQAQKLAEEVSVFKLDGKSADMPGMHGRREPRMANAVSSQGRTPVMLSRIEG